MIHTVKVGTANTHFGPLAGNDDVGACERLVAKVVNSKQDLELLSMCRTTSTFLFASGHRIG